MINKSASPVLRKARSAVFYEQLARRIANIIDKVS